MLKISCIALGVLFISTSIQGQVRDHLGREIQKIITYDAQIDYTLTPGLIVGVIWEDSAFVFPYGVSSKEDSLPLNDTYLFELGEYTQVLPPRWWCGLHKRAFWTWIQAW
ncbi:MAG: hypothetical protein IPJ40_23855 [Saprospirales bacterium]|nr:hypothetical protein [Saprospirales bacterium]